jgi:hypothetical protein
MYDIAFIHDMLATEAYIFQRDQEQREALVQTIRTLRTEASDQTKKVERLQTRNDDLERQVSLSQAQERSAKLALRTAESSARVLREEISRLKTTVQQVRTACANDVRKRDVQIQRLKTHLTAQQRGNKTGPVGASITITPGSTGLGAVTSSRDDEGLGTSDPEYSLKQETNEFLTQLSQSLSDENDSLIGLIRSALSTLRELQGLPENAHLTGGNGPIPTDEDQSEEYMLHALPVSYETLASDVDTVLENLRSLLTNPNFVPIEEVELREQQIVRLRAGWEKMEQRCREAFSMIEGWRKRILRGGETVSLDELKMGLGLGLGLATINGETDMSTISEAEEEDDDDGEVYGATPGDEGTPEFDDIGALSEVEDSLAIPQDSPLVTQACQKDSKTEAKNALLDVKLPRNAPLHEVNGNPRSPKKVMFASNSSHLENLSDAEVLSSSTPDLKPSLLAKAVHKQSESRIPRQVCLNSPWLHFVQFCGFP